MDKSLDQIVFEKMGWVDVTGRHNGWVLHTKPLTTLKELPKISSIWEETARFLVPFMREKDYEWTAQGFKNDSTRMDFLWWGDEHCASAEIKDDNIAEAACRAFMEVEL